MKKMVYLLLVISMFFMLGASPAGGTPNVVVLKASQVTSALDIEHAIDTATNNGTRRGMVMLDSSEGDFVYTGEDRSINIYYSNFVLRSLNKAVLANCGDGVFFDDKVANRVVIRGITFNCDGVGVNAWGPGTHKGVMLRRNVFNTKSFAIEAQHAERWMILGNRAKSEAQVIHLLETTGAMMVNNQLEGFIGVFLEKSNHNKLINNRITATWQGVLLGLDTASNRVLGNKIVDVQQSGISFEGGSTFTSAIANRIKCATGFTCVIVNIDNPPLSPTNRIKANRFIK
jgi:parallel beta-helix repeat protein